jgi:hypothetical protein
MSRRTVWTVVGVLTSLGLVVGMVATVYVRRISPPWPAVAGDPYRISLAADGCPIVPEQVQFVDSPGPLVPPNPTEVVLCAIPTGLVVSSAANPDEPRVRVLRTGAVGFAGVLNGLPDRNADWRRWQRQHSGWWPDAPPEHFCLMIGYRYDYSFVLHYADGPPVALISKCGTGGLTSGTRTRIDSAKPHVVDVFLQRYSGQR